MENLILLEVFLCPVDESGPRHNKWRVQDFGLCVIGCPLFPVQNSRIWQDHPTKSSGILLAHDQNIRCHTYWDDWVIFHIHKTTGLLGNRITHILHLWEQVSGPGNACGNIIWNHNFNHLLNVFLERLGHCPQGLSRHP